MKILKTATRHVMSSVLVICLPELAKCKFCKVFSELCNLVREDFHTFVPELVGHLCVYKTGLAHLLFAIERAFQFNRKWVL